MNRAELVSSVKDVLAETINNPEAREMSESSLLKDDIGLDSMTSLTFLLALEDKLQFTVDPTTLNAADFLSIGSICNYISHQMKNSNKVNETHASL